LVLGAAIGANLTAEVHDDVLTLCGKADLSPWDLASILVDGVERSTGAFATPWTEVWADVEGAIIELLDELGRRSSTINLKRVVLRRMEVAMLRGLPASCSGRVGGMQLINVDLSKPLADVPLDAGVERVRGQVARNGRVLGHFQVAAEHLLTARRIRRILEEDFGYGLEQKRPAARRAPESGNVIPQIRRSGKPSLVRPAGPDGIPILAYHRIAADGPSELMQYRIAPDKFAAQLEWLAGDGWNGLTLEGFEAIVWSGVASPPRAVMITFDDGYSDFMTGAVPILRYYKFPATVFLPTAHIGGVARWDATHGTPVPLLNWEEVRRLAKGGVEFGAHGARHLPLSSLSVGEVDRELSLSRTTLAAELDRPCTAMAYPYGDVDEAVAREAYWKGYRLGFTTREGLWRRSEQALTLPRIEVRGEWTLGDFQNALGA
jgi:peptidoglycan/xylan/chitin deacetylase (PgdA/CDA1 family)